MRGCIYKKLGWLGWNSSFFHQKDYGAIMILFYITKKKEKMGSNRRWYKFLIEYYRTDWVGWYSMQNTVCRIVISGMDFFSPLKFSNIGKSKKRHTMNKWWIILMVRGFPITKLDMFMICIWIAQIVTDEKESFIFLMRNRWHAP